jgi:hypothetical protein
VKNKIFGRKVDSPSEMSLLIEGNGISTGGNKIDPVASDKFAVASARRAVQVLRDKNIEGYIVFENDPTQYGFSPDTDFVYPATVH